LTIRWFVTRCNLQSLRSGSGSPERERGEGEWHSPHENYSQSRTTEFEKNPYGSGRWESTAPFVETTDGLV
jgi:hypothetical protein